MAEREFAGLVRIEADKGHMRVFGPGTLRKAMDALPDDVDRRWDAGLSCWIVPTAAHGVLADLLDISGFRHRTLQPTRPEDGDPPVQMRTMTVRGPRWPRRYGRDAQ